MAMMDSFFSKGFKAAKCRTLLKLTIPRIKLLRNRREVQLKNMRKEIAKLLETGQEATARIKVEHIIREEKMMAAQEIVELFCELITVRLPIIEAQRECPLDLKEAISSVCFAAPRCADLTELLQVQMLFAAKYGKEFVAAATELRPECGVNRQLIELLSTRAPPPEVKLKLLKEIAEEHELDWDPSASESELLKPHEDLLNGPAQFVSGSKLPVSQELHDEPVESAPAQVSHEQSDSDDFETIDFPEVPTQPLRSVPSSGSAPEMLPFPASALSDDDEEAMEPSGGSEISSHKEHLQPGEAFQGKAVSKEYESSDVSAGPLESKQFLPFISPPSLSSASSSLAQNNPPPVLSSLTQNNPPPVPSSFTKNNPPPISLSFAQIKNNPPPVSSSFPQNSPPPVSRTKSEINVDLQDVLAAAQAAAESAERAAAAARSAASLAQLRISELVKGKNGVVCDARSDDTSHCVDAHKSDLPVKSQLDRPSSFKEHVSSPLSPHQNHENNKMPNILSYDDAETKIDPSLSNANISSQMSTHQFQRLPSMDDDPYFSYPNLFTKQNSSLGSHSQSFTENSRPSNEK